jgi:hypothetical protein
MDPPGSDAPGCGELRRILADARHNGDPRQGGRPRIMVLPAALRLTVTRHLSQCGTCQGRRDDCMARWAPELLPILAHTELNEQVMEDLQPAPEVARSRAAHGTHRRGTHRRGAPVGTTATVVVRPPAAAAGAGLLAALLLLAFVWPGFLHGTTALVPRGSTAPSSPDPSSNGRSSSGAPQVTGTIDGLPGHNNKRQVRTGSAGLLSSLPPAATGSSAAPSLFASPTPPVRYGVQPSSSTPAVQQTSGTSPTSSPPAPSPSASAPQRTGVPSTPSPSTSPSSSPSPSASPTSTPSPSTSSTPSPTTSPSSTPSASSTTPQPTVAPSTLAPS